MAVLQPGRHGRCQVSVWRWCINRSPSLSVCGGGARSLQPAFVSLSHSWCMPLYKAPTNPAHSTPAFQSLFQSQQRNHHFSKRQIDFTKTSKLKTTRQFRSVATLINPATDCKADPGDDMSETKWTGTRVRQTFHDYFAERGHTVGTRQLYLLATIAIVRHTRLNGFLRCDNVSTNLVGSLKITSGLLTLETVVQYPRPRSFRTMTPPCSSPMLV